MWLPVFFRVFKNGWYLLLSLVVLFFGLTISLLSPNFDLVIKILASTSIGISAKVALIGSLYGSIFSNYTLVNGSLTLILLVLFSVNISLFVFYIRRAQKGATGFKRTHVRSLAGIVSGVFGIGCAACGSVVLTGLAASLGATGVLLMLPLHGGEFTIFGVVLLVWSIYFLVKKINNPLVCRV